MNKEIEEKVIGIVADLSHTIRRNVHAGSALAVNLGMNLLDIVALATAIENKFGIKIINAEYDDWKTVACVIDFVVAETMTDDEVMADEARKDAEKYVKVPYILFRSACGKLAKVVDGKFSIARDMDEARKIYHDLVVLEVEK